MKKYLILGLLVVSAAKFALAQDPHFSQIQYNPLYMTGYLKNFRKDGYWAVA